VLNSPMRVVIVDDHHLVVESFAALLDLDDGVEVVGTAFTAEDGARLVEELRPDVAVFDVDFPGRDSFDVVPQLIKSIPSLRVVFLTAHLSDVFVSQAIRMGACGYLLKDEPALVVRDALKRVHRGEFAFSTAVRDRLV
jgi:two-component system, NarL family, response regulator NreC